MLSSEEKRLLLERLKDPMWRLSNLYEIKLTDGRVIRYEPREFQRRLHEECYLRGKKRFLVPKSRRQGCSTCIGVMMADMAAFNEGWLLALVDRTQPDAEEKLREIVRVALESLRRKLPWLFKMEFNNKMITVEMVGRKSSRIVGGKYFRGSGLGFAHISELGTISATEPKRAAEIVNATFPAAKDGFIFVETTVRGGKKGIFYENVMNALSIEEGHRGEKDFNVVFLPWWEDESNVSDDDEPLTESTKSYFTTLKAKYGIDLEDRQKVWWQKAKRQHGLSMNEEYPSTLDEAFEVPMEGAILEEVLEASMRDGHFLHAPYDPTLPCYATWDLGNPLNTVSTVFQLKEGLIWIVDSDCGQYSSEGPAQRTARLLSRFPTLMRNIFPHDAGYTTDTGLSQAYMWQQAGLPGIVCLPRIRDKWISINYLLGMFPLLRFDIGGTEKAYPYWLSYRMKPALGENGAYKNEIVHDSSSHWSDSLRYIAEARMAGLLGNVSGGGETHVKKSFGRNFSNLNIDRNNYEGIMSRRGGERGPESFRRGF